MPSGNQIQMPAVPLAPVTIEPLLADIVASSTSVFTGAQQFYNWGVGPCELSASFPPMSQAQAQPWITFLEALQGTANYFCFSSSFQAAYSEILVNGSNPRYWRLKDNKRKWTVDRDRYYRISLDCREAF
jgi:hypothetical protein